MAAIAWQPEPHRHVPAFLAWYALAFVAYLLALRVVFRGSASGSRALVVMLVVAVAGRALLVPSTPDLSTDIYRYVWEGRVVLKGENPFAITPADTALAPLRDATWERVSHKHLATIYPPLAQGVFALGVRIHDDARTLKLLFVLCDLATLACVLVLLKRRGLPRERALVYAWSPLVMVETAHSGHLDALGILGLVLALLALSEAKRVRAGVALGASVLSKYLALVFVPWLLVRRRWVTAAVTVMVCGAGYLLFFDAGLALVASLRAYGDGWWFNGPPFMALSGLLGDATLVRRLLTGFGVLFAVIAALRTPDPVRYAYLVIGAAVLVSPTVYPWYVTWLVPVLCVFPNPAWIAFTALVALSYLVWDAYAQRGAWLLPGWVLALEYLPFYALLAWGALRKRATDA